jgi:hypothetical protein
MSKNMSDAQEIVDNPQEEEELLKQSSADEIRQKVIEDYGFDEEVDGDKIDKLVAEKIESSKKLSTAIKQKITWREKVGQNVQKPEEKPQEKPKGEEFSPKDYLALAQANVPAEDFDEVQEHAKFKGIFLADALKTPYIKSYLKEKAEERKTAEVAQTGSARRPSKTSDDNTLLEKLDKGELPEEDIEKAVKARIERMRNRGT